MKSRPPVARRPWMAGGMGTDGAGTANATAKTNSQSGPDGPARPHGRRAKRGPYPTGGVSCRHSSPSTDEYHRSLSDFSSHWRPPAAKIMPRSA